MKHNRIILALSLIGLAVLILMLNLTSPVEVGPLGVLLFFGSTYAVFLGLTVFFMKIFYRLALRRSYFRNKDYLYAVVMAFGPIMILMARSLGAIDVWVIGLVVIFVFLTDFLIYKRV